MAGPRKDTLDVYQPRFSRIPYEALLTVIWSLTGLCIALVAARLTIHIRFRRRHSIDDVLVVLALCILISNSVVTTLMAPPMYNVLKVAHGLPIPGPDFMANSTFYLKCQFTSTVLFWSCLWTVKACFLAFFFSLSSKTLWPRRFWWAVTAFTAMSYVGCIITYPLSCNSFVLGECDKPDNIRLSAVSLYFSTVVDMICDFLIIIIPIWLVLGLKMSLAQKLGLLGILCLGIVTMVFAAVRVAVMQTEGGKQHPEISWLALWSGIESSVAVSVACMTSFRVLFTHMRHGSSARHRQYYESAGGRVYPSSTGAPPKASHGSKKAWRSSTRDLGEVTEVDVEMEKLGQSHLVHTTCVGIEEARAASQASERDWPDTASQERILPEEAICVKTTWQTTHV